MDATGNVRVTIKFRPSLDASEPENEADNIAFDETAGTIAVKMPYSGRKELFAFSSVHRAQSNEVLFEEVGRPLCDSVLRGYHGALLTYGQTGSGKTFTMGEAARIGSLDEGMAHRSVRHLFSAIAADGEHSYEVSMQYVQVYCEKIYDLLGEKPRAPEPNGNCATAFGTPIKRATSARVPFGDHGSAQRGANTPIKGDAKDAPPEDTSLSLREDKKNGVFVQGATTRSVSSTEEALALMERASAYLVFASTELNQHSSRSHSLCTLLVKRTERVSSAVEAVRQAWHGAAATLHVGATEGIGQSPVLHAKMVLVDLAGSEDVGRSRVKGQGLAEAQKINTSLLALGNVIDALTHSEMELRGGKKIGGATTHVPFRSSVLTRLLSDSIGGNCRTALICCCSPAAADLSETLSTLRFGSRAKLVRYEAMVNACMPSKSLAEARLQDLQAKLKTTSTTLSLWHARHGRSAARALLLGLKLKIQKRKLAVENDKVTAMAEALVAAEVRRVHALAELQAAADADKAAAVAAAIAAAEADKAAAVAAAIAAAEADKAAAVAAAIAAAEADKAAAVVAAVEAAEADKAAAVVAAVEAAERAAQTIAAEKLAVEKAAFEANLEAQTRASEEKLAVEKAAFEANLEALTRASEEKLTVEKAAFEANLEALARASEEQAVELAAGARADRQEAVAAREEAARVQDRLLVACEVAEATARAATSRAEAAIKAAKQEAEVAITAAKEAAEATVAAAKAAAKQEAEVAITAAKEAAESTVAAAKDEELQMRRRREELQEAAIAAANEEAEAASAAAKAAKEHAEALVTSALAAHTAAEAVRVGYIEAAREELAQEKAQAEKARLEAVDAAVEKTWAQALEDRKVAVEAAVKAVREEAAAEAATALAKALAAAKEQADRALAEAVEKMAEQAAHGQALAQVAALEAVQELQWGAFSKAERLLRLRAERECT
jgi:hypothetical protein